MVSASKQKQSSLNESNKGKVIPSSKIVPKNNQLDRIVEAPQQAEFSNKLVHARRKHSDDVDNSVSIGELTYRESLPQSRHQSKNDVRQRDNDTSVSSVTDGDCSARPQPVHESNSRLPLMLPYVAIAISQQSS